MTDFEFYETPETFTRYLASEVLIEGTCFEPCVGDGALVRILKAEYQRRWITNDIDPRWQAQYHWDATDAGLWSTVTIDHGAMDWTVSNPAFTPAIKITDHAIRVSRVGVAMHLRVSIHEVLKTGLRRTWMAEHPPTGILYLPRFAYQRSKKTGKWTTDSAAACWCVWYRELRPQFIRYAPEWVIDELEAETPAYRARMDALMGYSGTEIDRQRQRKAA
jgi:hypothetical protein